MSVYYRISCSFSITNLNAETDLSKLKAFDTIGGALEIEYDANHISAVEEILTE